MRRPERARADYLRPLDGLEPDLEPTTANPARRRRSGGWQPLVSVNLSAEQLAAPAVVETLGDDLHADGCAEAHQ